MRVYDSVGREVVCTATKDEWEAAQEADPVHFVQTERTGWGSDD